MRLYGTYPVENKEHGLGYRTRKVAIIGLERKGAQREKQGETFGIGM